MRRVPCAVSVNLRKVTGDELRIVCSAVQYCVLYRPNCARLRKWALVLMSDPLDNHNVVVCGIAPQCRVVWCVVCSACQGAENAGRRLAVKLAAHPLSPRTAQQSLDWLRA